MAVNRKSFCGMADLGWGMARIGFSASSTSAPYADHLVIATPSDGDENGFTPASSVQVSGEANILALGALIDEWKAARAAAMNPES